MTTTRSTSTGIKRLAPDRSALGGVVALGLVCAGLVALAWLLSRHADSSATGMTAALPLPAVSADAGCENFGDYWTDTSGAGVAPDAIALFTNCRLGDDGTWIAGPLYGSGRIDESALTQEQRDRLQTLRTDIGLQIDGLEGALPTTVRETIAQLETDQPNPVVGTFREGVGWGSARTRYARIVNAYMLDPDNAELASFIGWIMGRKIEGYGQLRRTCLGNEDVAMLHTACRGMEDNLSIRYAPLPFVLRDPALLDTWFYETVVVPEQATEG